MMDLERNGFAHCAINSGDVYARTRSQSPRHTDRVISILTAVGRTESCKSQYLRSGERRHLALKTSYRHQAGRRYSSSTYIGCRHEVRDGYIV